MNITTAIETLKKQGYEPIGTKEVQDVCLYLLGMDEMSIKRIISDKSLPMIFRIVGRELLSDKGFEVIEKLLNRAIGKEPPTAEEKEFTIRLVDVKLPPYTSEKEILEKYNLLDNE